MLKHITSLAFVFLFFQGMVFSQDTLPNFSAKNVGGQRIVVSWKNQYTNIKQLSIQRSFDSTRGFTSIFSVVDPTLPENGYLDKQPPTDSMYYRLFIMLDKGEYLFSKSMRPVVDTSSTAIVPEERNNNGNTMVPAGFVPSKHVFTFTDGYVKVSLPVNDKKYGLKFFDENDRFIFEIKEVPSRSFKLDKANFHTAGWKIFELYENDKLIEKHKFYLKEEY